MLKIFKILLVFLCFFVSAGFVISAERIDEPENRKNEEVSDRVEETGKYKNVNIDMQIVYGIYNNMLSTIDLSQEQENFVYLLSSFFKRSNDFGYNEMGYNRDEGFKYKETKYDNSSFNENKIGFTGNYFAENLNIADSIKTIFEAEFNNDSRGMFDNLIYSREEKDRVKMSLKNIVKFTSSFEGFLTVGWSNYVHRLRAISQDQNVQKRLNRGDAESGGEIIWSASNRFRYKIGYAYYQFSPYEVKEDWNLAMEIIDDFNITRNIGISIGCNLDLNNDGSPLASPILGLSVKGLKVFSMSMLYRYDLVPFNPEEFYLEQKYINPSYNLPPMKVHHGEIKTELSSKIFNIKATLTAEKNNNYYNYISVYGDVLSAETVPVKKYDARVDGDLMVYKSILILALGYKYSHFTADPRITYRPEHVVLNSLKINSEKWRIEWDNKYFNDIYYDPYSDRKIPGTVLGYLNVQRKMLDGFSLFVRIENLYNKKYNLREGYPEPGMTALAGLRLLI